MRDDDRMPSLDSSWEDQGSADNESLGGATVDGHLWASSHNDVMFTVITFFRRTYF